MFIKKNTKEKKSPRNIVKTYLLEISTDPIDIKMKIKEYYEQHNTQK